MRYLGNTMSDKTIAMADNQTKRMDAHDHNRLRLQEKSIKTEKDEYQIDFDKPISIGGESQVFLAKRVSDNMQVVIKIYDKYDDRRNRRDRKAVLEFLKKNTDYKKTHIMPLWDDGIIKMFDPESDDYFDSPFDIIPFCPEGEIKSANYSQLKTKIIPEVLHALNLLHSNNLVHRDIKPQNIYMYDGVVLLADFGTT